MSYQSLPLKIKSKHLSVEAQIIRHEERKLLKQYTWALKKHTDSGNNDMYPRWNDAAFTSYCSLNKHRRWDVRSHLIRLIPGRVTPTFKSSTVDPLFMSRHICWPRILLDSRCGLIATSPRFDSLCV